MPSVPGARPRPRSIRSGYIASSVWNISATFSGAWLGSMIPPAPRRRLVVAAPTRAMISSGAVHASPRVLWCSENQSRR